MTLDHIAIWTHNLEVLKDYYVRFFDGVANAKYHNPVTGFESYFVSFGNCSRIELMQRMDIPGNQNDPLRQAVGIIHLAFGVAGIKEVIAKSEELENAGFKILKGPRKTGDGYFEFETLDPDNNRIEVTTAANPE